MGNESELSVLLLTPVGHDAELACRLLQPQEVACVSCRSPQELMERIAAGAGAVVVAEEALQPDRIHELMTRLDSQPSWSDLPLVILTARTRQGLAALLASRRNVTILARPIRVPTFVTVVKAAVESRRRQYAVRDLLLDLQRLNEHLVHRTGQLQEVTLQLTHAEQRERRRIAMEIHDYLAQLLVVGRLKLDQASLAAPPGPLRTLLGEIDHVVDQSLTYTRTLVADLSPQVLYHAGLPAALKWLGEQMKQHGLTVRTFLGVEAVPLSEERAALIYQSVRELLLNVNKHAGVDTATVSLMVEAGNQLTITVADEGKGFDPRAASGHSRGRTQFGLLSIQERLEALNGRCLIDSAPGKGMRTTLSIPLQATTPAQASSKRPPTPAIRRHAPSVTTIRVVLADDHAMLREGLRQILEAYPDLEVVGEAKDGAEAVEVARELVPDVVIMDVNMPGINGVMATRQILQRFPQIKVIGLSYDASTRSAMMEAGAATQVDKANAAGHLYRAICVAKWGKPHRLAPDRAH